MVEPYFLIGMTTTLTIKSKVYCLNLVEVLSWVNMIYYARISIAERALI
jgi:hypothetical protein